MRNPLARLTRRDPDAPTLREKLADVRERYTRTLRIHRVLNAPLPQPEPPVDRLALISYATWLYMERRLVCRELYPHEGVKADAFVLSNCAGDRFHFPHGLSDKSDIGTTLWKPSTRAVQVLDLVGVDWRADLTDETRADLDPPFMQRPRLGLDPQDPPHGWPALDGALLTALADLRRLDAAIDALVGPLPAGRDVATVPGYEELSDARLAVLDILTDTRADSLLGLRAKAKALLVDSVQNDPDMLAAVAHSLGADLADAPQHVLNPRPDPIFDRIAEARRLTAEHDRLLKACGGKPQTDPGWDAEDDASNAMWEFIRGPLIAKAPLTARGCAALARFAIEFTASQHVPIEPNGNDAVLKLIAGSPLL